MENELALYKMNLDCGRNGSLSGIFLAKKSHVRIMYQYSLGVDFGEVLGKHSSVCGHIEPNEIEFITDDENVINVVQKYGLENGYNPFNCEVYANYEYGQDILSTICEIIENIENENEKI